MDKTKDDLMRLTDPVTSDDHVQGAPDASVTLVQYGDYECPYTRMSRHAVHQLQREFPQRLRFVFRHFPLEEIHPHARAAAMAAEAAGAQTNFWTMHEYLFEHQNQLDDSDLRNYASALGLDTDRFDRDWRSSEIARRIDRDLDSGDRSGVQGTPTFYVNGIRHDGGYDLESLRTALTRSRACRSRADLPMPASPRTTSATPVLLRSPSTSSSRRAVSASRPIRAAGACV
jgi:protein-disulfide isomerase